MGKKKESSGTTANKNSKSQQEKQKSLQKSQKNRRFAKIYREYSRKKYQKYKFQFPKLRESEIIDKIIKEWEALTDDDKIKLQKQFIQIGGSAFLSDNSKSKSGSSKSKSKSKSDSVVKQDEAKQEQEKDGQVKQEQPLKKKKKKPSPKVRVFVQKAIDKTRNFMEDSELAKPSSKQKQQASDNESIQVLVKGKKPKKTKIISKQKNQQNQKNKKQSQYLTFFKYYYNRLQAEHPRWNKVQIGTIVKLLWRKRNSKQTKKSKRPSRLSSKPISGRRLFKRQKKLAGLTDQQIKLIWKQLPFESKKFWQIKGRGSNRPKNAQISKSARQLKLVMKQGSDPSQKQLNALKFMNTLISQ